MAQLDGKYRWTEYRDVPTAARVIEHAPQCSGESYQTAEGGKAAAAASVTISPRCYNNNNTSNEPRASAGSILLCVLQQSFPTSGLRSNSRGTPSHFSLCYTPKIIEAQLFSLSTYRSGDKVLVDPERQEP